MHIQREAATVVKTAAAKANDATPVYPAPVVVSTRRGDLHVIRQSYGFLDGDRQKLRVVFGDGLEAIYDGFWLRCKAEEVAE